MFLFLSPIFISQCVVSMVVVVVVVIVVVVVVCAVAVIVFDLLLSSITVVIPSKFYPGLPLYQSMTPKAPHWSILCSQFWLYAKPGNSQNFHPVDSSGFTHLLASNKNRVYLM